MSVDHGRRRRMRLEMCRESRLDEHIGLQVRRGGVSLHDVGQRGARDHSRRLPVKSLILPEEAISRP